MSWLKILIAYIVKKVSDFLKIGENMKSQYPKLLSYFNKNSDAELKDFIIQANVIKDRNGRIQIQVMTTIGWEFLDESFLNELKSILGEYCFEVDLQHAGDVTAAFQQSLNNFYVRTSKTFSKAVRKNNI